MSNPNAVLIKHYLKNLLASLEAKKKEEVAKPKENKNGNN